MARFSKIVSTVSEQTGLRGDEKTGVISGNYRGYSIIAEPVQQHSLAYKLKVSVNGANGEWMDQKSINQRVKETSSIRNMERYGNTWVVNLKNKMTAGKQGELVSEAIRELADVLRSENQRNVCSRCGEEKTTDTVMISGTSQILCSDCFHAEQSEGIQRQMELDEKPEKIAGGIMGAFLGSLIGVALIVLLGQLGYVAAISGVVMGVCALKGYELLGGKLSNKGIIISVIIMIIMVWIGNRIDWSISLWREVFTEETPFSVFRYFGDAMAQLSEEGSDLTDAYFGSLLQQYLFSALGAVGVIFTRIRQRRSENTAERI